MRLAYSTNAFTLTTLEAAIDAIAALGFEGVEILCDRPHWFASEVEDREADAIAERLSERGLAVSNLNANTANGYYRPAPPESTFEPALSNEDPTLRAWRQRYTIRAIELAKRLGARSVSVTSGRPQPAFQPARALAHFVESLKPICEVAEREGVSVGIEYEQGLLVERAAELAEVLVRVDSGALGANLDLGHSYLAEESPEEMIGILAGRIWNVHVDDIKDMKHWHLVPGDGDLPFGRYFDALRRARYDGFLTVELYNCIDCPEEAGRRSLAYLSRLRGLRPG